MNDRRPNILFIMSDDHAATAISAYGSRLARVAPTPNIDRIATEGMRFDNCHCTNSICTPSRASILTGQHGHVNGVRTLADELPESAVLVSELLQGEGYQTALFGKWHLGVRPRGFDEWAVLPGQGIYHDPYFVFPTDASLPSHAQRVSPEEATSYQPQELEQYSFGALAKVPGYVTDRVTDFTLDYVDRVDRTRPFFLCCHHKAPHDFFEYAHRHEHIFDGVELPEPSTLFEPPEVQREISRRFGSTVSERYEPRNMVRHLADPAYPNGGPIDFTGLSFDERTRKAYRKYTDDYLRTVRAIDENVGRILDYLDEHDLARDTVVVYTSDQGMMLGEHDHIDKRWIFDESQRMPFLARYPARVAPGSINRDVVDNTDFAPTFLDLAGAGIPEHMQGRSFTALLDGTRPAGWRQSCYYRYWMHMAHHGVPAHYGIRTDRYKLIFFYGLRLDASGCTEPECAVPTAPGWELYDLQADPEETTNVYEDPSYATIRDQLAAELDRLKTELRDTDEAYPELAALRS